MKHKKAAISVWYCDECPNCESTATNMMLNTVEVTCSEIGVFTSTSTLCDIPDNCPLEDA